MTDPTEPCVCAEGVALFPEAAKAEVLQHWGRLVLALRPAGCPRMADTQERAMKEWAAQPAEAESTLREREEIRALFCAVMGLPAVAEGTPADDLATMPVGGTA